MESYNKIESFKVDHDLLEPGIYISRIDGDVITYDLRTRKPNAGSYMDNITMHSLEHMFATFARNSDISNNVIYFGPMGCQTGFYFLVKDEAPLKVFELTKEILKKIIAYEGEMFGAKRKECGNYLNLSLDSAKKESGAYLEILEKLTTVDFKYAE
ncbi:MAG: S-ribosylhomocysteine lyase [Ruminococcaceae bacterium]|nr:S-ribosylhomocysteine lyase [Oscillospiraceae bacterium]